MAKYRKTDRSLPLQPASRSVPPLLVAVFLAIISLALFSPAISHDFINYDDPDYVTQNPHVQSGITRENVVWAFGNIAGDATYWHPLTWMSHMLDCQMFGLKPAGHHAVSIFLHAINTAILFLLLRRATGTFWCSLIVAVLFAIHPLKVDTVAWVTERKNILSTLFWFLTLYAYVSSCESKSGAKPAVESGRYLLALFLFALGLMCKPMLVTVPCVLLLLDIWPLKRIDLSSRATFRQGLSLIYEKIPFFVLSAASAIITVAAHKKLGLVVSERQLSFGERIINSAVSYFTYFAHTVWPDRLAIYYPIPDFWPIGGIVLGFAFIIGIIAVVIWALRKCPAISVGCLWFLGTLVPVIGILQVGIQSMADRFMYVPIIGLFIAIVWGFTALGDRFPSVKRIMPPLAFVAVVSFSVATTVQLRYWKNSHTLFAHAAKVIPNNIVAEVMLGVALEHEGDLDSALRQYEKALQMRPEFPQMHYDIANILAQQKKFDAAIGHYRSAIQLNPSYAEAHFNLAAVLEMNGTADEAIPEYEAALKIHPNDFDTLKALGTVLEMKGQHAMAAVHLSTACSIRAGDAELHHEFAKALAGQNKIAEAVGECERALQLQPDFVEAHVTLANLLKGQGRIAEATKHLQEAARLRPQAAPPSPSS